MKRALVLSGGGAKGSFQIGVWKALRRLHIKIDIVTGCSIGSINGALFVERKYFLAKKMWKNIKTDDLFKKDNHKLLKDIGLKNELAEKYLRKIINEDRVKRSRIDYGLVAYNLNKKTPKMLSKDMIPKGKLVDYIMASSTFYPFIEKKKIDDEYYIDGGFYDNMPINLAIEMGADEVIAVDLNNIGIKRKINNKNIDIKVIKNHETGFGTLEFNKKIARKRIKLGYNETMKVFNKLDGNIYTFKKNNLLNNYNNIKEYYTDLLKVIFFNNKKNIILDVFKINKYNKLFTEIKQNKDISNTILESIEYLGNIFDIDKENIYSIKKYNRILLERVKEYNYLKIGTKLKGKMLIGYIYNKYMNSNNKEKVYKELFNLALIFPKEFMASIYLISISERYPLILRKESFYTSIYGLLKK